MATETGSNAERTSSCVAVICNPVKTHRPAALRSAVTSHCRQLGWNDPMWFETTAQDPGVGQTRAAVQAGADLVLVSGGDGTVAACATTLSGTAAALAIIPAGTGNLLARNLGVPLHRSAALALAFGPGRRKIDVIEAGDGSRFVVMAGLGFDAAMIADTNERTKARIGWVAYVAGIARALRGSPCAEFEIVLNGTENHRFRAVGVLAGNVGNLQAGLSVLPHARPDNGLLDLVVLAPRTWRDWPLIALRMATGRTEAGRQTEVLRAAEISITVDRELPLEFDGELRGQSSSLTLRVLPGALTIAGRV